MKKRMALVLFLLAIAGVVKSQQMQIASLTYYPNTPVVGDTILVLCDFSVTSFPCDLTTDTTLQLGQSLYGKARHCVGTISSICFGTDTFSFANLIAGDYWFYYHIGYTQTCNWGAAPFPYLIDSILISVSNPDGVHTPSGFSSVQSISVYNINGQFLFEAKNEKEISLLTNIPSGIYIVKKRKTDGSTIIEKTAIIK